MENRLTADMQVALDASTAALLLAGTKRADLRSRVIGHLGRQGILDLLAGDTLQHGIGDMLVETFLDRLEGPSPAAVRAAPAAVPEEAVEVEKALEADEIVEVQETVVAPPAPHTFLTSLASDAIPAYYDAMAAANRIRQSVGQQPRAAGARREWSRQLEKEITDELRKLRAMYGPDPRSTNTRFRNLCDLIEGKTRGKIDRAAVKSMADTPPVTDSP
ncbi:hypothetical protein HUE56_15085 [Azospirillum oryzae]|uniref:Uncharacterized protein n=1 Tax=Azospirillum oryzae TaxID=286727 RepID=A0A6N1ARJ1_9PROT|nr:hypothetical protein [Azospirillum oryzae]KAA0589935.1 hypothetical protein FZ938_10085 [Azospirillum oryzae]QKS51774.1 hypothetical protein HUE56_15085 [Azospirillum oryzae]GLR81401.1 hypothetical protein GCM10007856_40870 [Azospirillum oryzae]